MKRVFTTIDEELDAMEKWFNESDYCKIVDQIKTSCEGYFPKWKSDYGFDTNDLNLFVAAQESGFNGREVPFAKQLMQFLGNHDIICIENATLNVESSNDNVVAKLIQELLTLSQGVLL